MAIKIQITEDNGVVTEYHRIALMSIDVNHQNTILVHSYLSADGRQVEKDYAAGLYQDVEVGMMRFPYVSAEYIHTPPKAHAKNPPPRQSYNHTRHQS